MSMKIWPYKPGDRGILCMPLYRNVPNPNKRDWSLTVCPKCGVDCWESDLLRETLPNENVTALCTECAFLGVNNGEAPVHIRTVCHCGKKLELCVPRAKIIEHIQQRKPDPYIECTECKEILTLCFDSLKGGLTYVENLLAEVQTIVCNEYQHATEKFGLAHSSQHESFAVILEEMDEAIEQTELFRGEFKYFWEDVKRNKCDEASDRLLTMRMFAEQAAAEWIQVAAMCKKGGGEA